MTLVLVHGSAHTAAAWDELRAALASPSVALDLPGRAGRPGDITRVSLPAAADELAAEVEGGTVGDLVLVGHSAGGMLLPFLAARLGPRVRHLVFVAGLIAADGGRVVDLVAPDRVAGMEERLAELRRDHGGATLETLPDPRLGQGIDSLNLMLQTISWDGVPPDLPRTWIRCLRDAIQPRPLQAALAAACGAGRVLDIDSGHNAMLERPRQLAALLDGIAIEPWSP